MAVCHTVNYRQRGYFCILILALTFVWAGGADAKYGGGIGSADDPYLISSAEHLSQIGHEPADWDKYFKLMADVDMSNYDGLDGRESFETIGYLQWEPYESNPFTGVFEGNGKRITNLTITAGGQDCVGLFGYVRGSNALIKNITLVNPAVDGTTAGCTGALVGRLRDGCVTGCKVEAGSISGADCTGGLVGYNMFATIKNCTIQADVTGTINVGGVAGYHRGVVISDCSFTGNVTGWADSGGLVGENDGQIVNCFASGSIRCQGDKVGGLAGTSRGQVRGSYAVCDINGIDKVGGLLGRNRGQVSDSYAKGTVTGRNYVGGLAGLLYAEGTISQCYTASYISSSTGLAGPIIGWGEMTAVTASFWIEDESTQTAMTLQDTYIVAGWDFVGETDNGIEDLWDICEGMEFPRLWWEGWEVGDWVCPAGVDINDIVILFEMWLVKTASADIAGGTGEGVVNFEDLAALASVWMAKAGQPGWDARYDIWPDTGDGIVDDRDLAVLVQNWLKGGSNPAQLDSATGDGIVNLLDWVVFADAWRSAKWSLNWDARCDIAPDGGDGVIDEKDLEVFCERWLATGAGFGDIAPIGYGDGIVNFFDFALAADSWIRIN